MSFMYEAGGVPFLRRAEPRRTPFRLAPFSSPKRIDGGLLQRPPTLMRLAETSCSRVVLPHPQAQNEIYVQLFQTPDEEEEERCVLTCWLFAAQEDNIRKLRKVAASGEESDKAWRSTQRVELTSSKACRYCLVDSGDLVAPCECKGSGQWVHLSCLRQWQKSVLLTQSTHPKYQTRIDEICNVCERPFKEEFKPRSRREALLEYTGEELPKLIQKGNLLAMLARTCCR